MVQEAQALGQLAERMKLTQDAAANLPVCIEDVAQRLKVTTLEVIEICRFNPTLVTYLADSCKKKLKSNKTSGHYRSTVSRGNSGRGAVHTA